MFFTRVWLVAAVFSMLPYSAAMADSYLRVNQRGVISYHVNNPDPLSLNVSPAPKPRENLPLLQKVVPSQGPADRLNLDLVSVSAPGPALAASNQNTKALPAPEGELILEAPDPAPAAPPLHPQENMGEIKRGFLKLLTKLKFFDPPQVTTEEDEDDFIRNTCFLVPDVWAKVPKHFPATVPNPQLLACLPGIPSLRKMPPLPKYAYETRLWGRVAPGGSFKPSSSQFYCFPVARSFTFRDSWGDPRPNGRIHRAVDIFAPEGTELYAITSGVIHGLATSSTGGIMLMLQGNDGRGYGYMHLMAYAEGIVVGKAVRAGELIGYVGHTGTQNCPAHLHIQVYPDHQFSHETLVDPYSFLVQLCRGIGVSDVNQPRVARQQNTANQIKIARQFDPMAKNKNSKIKWIQVDGRPWPKGWGQQTLKLDIKTNPKSSQLLIIRNN